MNFGGPNATCIHLQNHFSILLQMLTCGHKSCFHPQGSKRPNTTHIHLQNLLIQDNTLRMQTNQILWIALPI